MFSSLALKECASGLGFLGRVVSELRLSFCSSTLSEFGLCCVALAFEPTLDADCEGWDWSAVVESGFGVESVERVEVDKDRDGFEAGDRKVSASSALPVSLIGFDAWNAEETGGRGIAILCWR